MIQFHRQFYKVKTKSLTGWSSCPSMFLPVINITYWWLSNTLNTVGWCRQLPAKSWLQTTEPHSNQIDCLYSAIHSKRLQPTQHPHSIWCSHIEKSNKVAMKSNQAICLYWAGCRSQLCVKYLALDADDTGGTWIACKCIQNPHECTFLPVGSDNSSRLPTNAAVTPYILLSLHHPRSACEWSRLVSSRCSRPSHSSCGLPVWNGFPYHRPQTPPADANTSIHIHVPNCTYVLT